MVAVQSRTKGRDFTAEELIGRRVRIEGPVRNNRVPIGMELLVIADDECVNNVSKIVLTLEPNAVVEAILTLYRFDLADIRIDKEPPTEEVTLRDNLKVSLSAIVSEVQ